MSISRNEMFYSGLWFLSNCSMLCRYLEMRCFTALITDIAQTSSAVSISRNEMFYSFTPKDRVVFIAVSISRNEMFYSRNGYLYVLFRAVSISRNEMFYSPLRFVSFW